MNQNLTEDREEEKAIPTRKVNMYFNNLVETKRLKYMIHVDLPRWDYRLLPHSDLQLYFDHLENDIDEYPDD